LLIDLNTASFDELDSLPQVGQATAENIIANRPYNNIDELITKKIVRKSVYEKIKDKIAVK